jgi:hypothetical protein
LRSLPPRWKTPELLSLFRAKPCGKKSSTQTGKACRSRAASSGAALERSSVAQRPELLR